MATEETPTLPATGLELPKYYPLHSSLGSTLSSLSFNPSSKQLKNLEQDLQKSYEKYVDISLNLNKDDLEKAKSDLKQDKVYNDVIGALENIKDIKKDNSAFTNAITQAKAEISYRFRNEEELNVETLRQYQNLSETPNEVYDLLVEITQTEMPNDSFNELENAVRKFEDQATVYIDPFAVVKHQEEENDDDLEVSGGKVELKCPLSQVLMKDPVITQCKHSFDKSSLDQYKRETRSSDCPVCGKKMGNVVKDDLMLYRLRGFERDQRLS